MLTGAIAASVTPLASGGAGLDEGAIGPLVRFLAEGGIDGILACGTTGEGILLTPEERRRAVERFLEVRPPSFQVAVHTGAQTTADTVALSAHAREAGADAVAVIAPPYFPLDESEIFEHLRAAAAAAAPLPFYVYEFAGRSGYAIPVAVVERLRAEVGNLAGMKVSDTPWSAVEPYVLSELDLFVGSEPLVLEGFAHGAAGAVSGLAAAFPEIVASLVHERSATAGEQVAALRRSLALLPFHASLKAILAARGVPVGPDVRPPLRGLTPDERERALDAAREVGALER
ncbi:MAG TPA: dihydrodipicolinate synthase family protein [Actinomycetota bacterium]|jgi:dihydrodipicolinate synthase/N-acetylneuraminate lyase|nr:dihydrodipicolinate synthase family protein [Actinomycetota bacterium]